MEEQVTDILSFEDISLEELRLALTEAGLMVPVAGLQRLFVRRGWKRSKKDWPCHRARPTRYPQSAQ